MREVSSKLSMEDTKEYLNIRRDRVKELWEQGYTLDEIGRYFEVSTDTVNKSLIKRHINFYDRTTNCKRPEGFESLMERRDGLMESGFWRKPKIYTDTAGNLILEELICGFKGSIIAQINECGSKDVIKISANPEYSQMIKEARTDREKIANEILGKVTDWSLDEVSEFIGLPKSRVRELGNAPKHRRSADKKNGALSYKKENLAIRIADEFLAGKNQKMIADEFDLSRATVSKYLKIIIMQNPEKGVLIKQKLKNHGADIVCSKKRFMETYSGKDEILAILQKNYVHDGCLIQTQKSIAKELGVSEQIIQMISKANGFISYKNCKWSEKGVEK